MKIITAGLTLAVAGAITIIAPNAAHQARQSQSIRFGVQAVRIESIRVEQADPLPRATVVRATRSKPHVYRALGPAGVGRATWYTGRIGACGLPLTGLYVASRTLPCGSHVRMSYGGRSVVATVLDRGPISTKRVLDLSKSAFVSLAPLSKGIIWVKWELVA
ncbi:MAG: septal ring lytic transglycosylase RlpA family protein [Actinomycetota bacterium]